MGILNDLKGLDASKIKGETDSLGGGRVLPTGLYDMTITMAYLDKSPGGAHSLNLLLDNDGTEVKQTLYFTNKAGLPYWERDGVQNFLPGYNQAQAICLLTVGKELADLAEATEEKLVKIYDFDAKKELPVMKEVLVDLIGEEICVGLMMQKVDKNAKNDATGKYEPTGETREENEIDKLFRSTDGLTVVEVRAQAEEPAFKAGWIAKWDGVVKDKTKGAKKAGGAVAGAPAGKAAPKLFGAK